MEAMKYGAVRGVAREESEGERRSPRLLEARTQEGFEESSAEGRGAWIGGAHPLV